MFIFLSNWHLFQNDSEIEVQYLQQILFQSWMMEDGYRISLFDPLWLSSVMTFITKISNIQLELKEKRRTLNWHNLYPWSSARFPCYTTNMWMMEKIFQFFLNWKGPFAKKNMFLQPCFSAVKYQRTKSAPLADECASTKAEAQRKHSKVQLLILPLISKPKQK